jgi:hypothetical protein
MKFGTTVGLAVPGSTTAAKTYFSSGESCNSRTVCVPVRLNGLRCAARALRLASASSLRGDALAHHLEQFLLFVLEVVLAGAAPVA